MRTLPLFPLHVVLFPDTMLPLHIFEERYKLMVERCLEGDSRFGVVLIKSGSDVGDPAEPYSVGTIAHIEEVERLDEGRLLISVKGESRFRINEIAKVFPYFEAEMEKIEDEAEVALDDDELDSVRATVTRHISLVLGLRGGWVGNATMPAEPVALSYFIPSLLQQSLQEKQQFLEIPAAAERLRKESEIMMQQAGGLRERVERELRTRITGFER